MDMREVTRADGSVTHTAFCEVKSIDQVASLLKMASEQVLEEQKEMTKTLVLYDERDQAIIHNVKKWGKFVTAVVQGTVHIIGNGDKSNIFLSKQHFRIKSYLKVITPDTAHIHFSSIFFWFMILLLSPLCSSSWDNPS